ncbi:alpha/beta hydrolase [Mesobacillus boroniphilus]|uniref:Alpha/beta hydrolase n=1 Tax=Mesobacillus boroniphilus TaxID=308892 RepID=A0A944CMM3_9BACI|nr:alpha/beta hydrolase [Mesobacillus boroniphilus]MBS8265337.1 alpha/beta hydrolase [Mesobacillus boroniphilus]
MPYAKIDDSLSLYYHIKGNGLPVVFIHPFVMGHNVFMHQEALAERYTTIFYDLAGHGWSSKGNQPVSIEGLAADLKRLLDELGIEKVVLCGYSYGGLVAQEFALKYPERSEALILSGGFSKIDTLIPKFIIKLVMLMVKFGQVSLAAKWQAKFHKCGPEDERKIYEYARRSDARRCYEYCKAGLNYDSSNQLNKLDMPILLVYGSLEKPMHHYRIPFQKKAPNMQVVYIKNGTHQLPPRSYHEFNKIVDRFLQKLNERFKLESNKKKEAGLG